jgi:hypothetical protein
MAAFVILCESHMGIGPHLNLWTYFFRTRLQLGSRVEVTALASVDIFLRSGCGVDPYFHHPMSNPPDGWWKVWFFLSNDTDASLPKFMGSRPVSQPNWHMVWLRGTSTCYNPCVRSFSSCYE